MSRSPVALLGICSAALLVLLMAGWLMPDGLAPTMQPHPAIPGLLQATTASAPSPLGLGAVSLMLAILTTGMWLGLRKNGQPTPLNRWLGIGMGVYTLLFIVLIVVAHHHGMTAGFAGGFPVATAWMIYGIWPFPLVLIGLYALNFDRWVMTDEDQQRFDALVRANRLNPPDAP